MNKSVVQILVIALLVVLLALFFIRRSSWEPGAPKSDQNSSEANRSKIPRPPQVMTPQGILPHEATVSQDPPSSDKRGKLQVSVHFSDVARRTINLLLINKATGRMDGSAALEGETSEKLFENLTLGSKILVAVPHCQDFAPAYEEVLIVEAPTVYTSLRLLEGKPVEGWVCDSTGTPASGAAVTAVLKLGYDLPSNPRRTGSGVYTVSESGEGWFFSSSGYFSRTVRTGPKGEFKIPNVGWGPVELNATFETTRSASQSVAPGTSTRLVLQR